MILNVEFRAESRMGEEFLLKWNDYQSYFSFTRIRNTAGRYLSSTYSKLTNDQCSDPDTFDPDPSFYLNPDADFRSINI